MACHKVCPTDFFYTKARAHDRELSIGAIFNVIAAMVRELCERNKKKKNKNKKTKRSILAIPVRIVWTVAR